MLFGRVLLTTDAADNHLLGMTASLGGVSQSQASGVLLDEGKGLETLGAHCTTKHEKGRLQNTGGSLAILIKEGEGH
jgi:hypothetical protein